MSLNNKTKFAFITVLLSLYKAPAVAYTSDKPKVIPPAGMGAGVIENLLLILMVAFVVYVFFIKPGRTVSKKAMMSKTVQELLFYKEITSDGLIVLSDGKYRRMVKVYPTNLVLKSPDEQANCWVEYRNTIDTLSVDWTKIIQSRIICISDYLDEQMQEAEKLKGKYPLLYEQFYRSFFVILTAENTYFGMFGDLFRGNFGDADCDVAIHVTSSDEQKVMWMLSRKIAGLEADLINETRSIKIKELKDQLADLHSQEERLRKNIEKLYSVSIQATISSDNLDGLKKFANRMIKRMANQGAFLRSADTKQLQSLLAITPLGDTKRDLKYTYKNMEISNIADMFPFKDGTISHTSGYLIGEDFYGKPVYYDDRHPTIQNYNSVTFGVAGSGKSMKTKILHSRKLIACTMTTIIDYEKGNKDWILKLGFPYIEFTASNTKYGHECISGPQGSIHQNRRKIL